MEHIHTQQIHVFQIENQPIKEKECKGQVIQYLLKKEYLHKIREKGASHIISDYIHSIPSPLTIAKNQLQHDAKLS